MSKFEAYLNTCEKQRNKHRNNRKLGLCACGRTPREGYAFCEKCQKVKDKYINKKKMEKLD
jgi:hypothetical protein